MGKIYQISAEIRSSYLRGYRSRFLLLTHAVAVAVVVVLAFVVVYRANPLFVCFLISQL